MKTKSFVQMALVVVVLLGVHIATARQEEVVPSERGSGREATTSRNCQLNSVVITPNAFKEGDEITATVVVVCNDPVKDGGLRVVHWPSGKGKSRRHVDLKTGKNVLRIGKKAGQGGHYEVRVKAADGTLDARIETVPVAWTAHKARFH